MKRLIVITLLLLSVPLSVRGGEAGTETPFAMGAGAADISLSGSAIASSAGWTAAYWNPSRLASIQQTELGGFHTRLFDSDVSYQYLGVAHPTLDWGTFGFGLFRLGIGGIEKRDASNLYLGDIEDSRLGLLLAYGRVISNYRIGLALSMEHHSIDNYKSTSSPGLNLAVSRAWEMGGRIRGVTAALVMYNVLSPSMKLDNEDVSLPLSTGVGVTIPVQPNRNWDHLVNLHLTLNKVDALPAQIAVGVEYSVGNLLTLRGGANDGKLTSGVGLKLMSVGFDYAFVDRDLGTLHMFNLTSSFGKSKSSKRQERAARREREFNELMSQQLTASNEKMLQQLLNRGEEALEAGDLEKAESQYDRALFLARSSGSDTAQIYSTLNEVRERLSEVQRLQQYNDRLDSAQVNLAAHDYLAARYYASLALEFVENSDEAQQVIKEAEESLRRESSREELIKQRTLLSDSLVSYGRTDEAINVLMSLVEIAPNDNSILMALRRAQFERLRAKASQAYSNKRLNSALVSLDSALGYFPGHQWCEEMKSMITGQIKSIDPGQPTRKSGKKTVLSAELQKEVSDSYKEGQRLFTSGNMTAAIENWEKVERILPDYASVREYLINAYKFVGVELYSRGELEEAVSIWRKAAFLRPDNQEIAEYIKRTENEIRKLKELSYEQ
ncbi:MAG: hypothetical protein P1R58_00615 [bacterium]|nr:hypothetical protein [bacterium]